MTVTIVPAFLVIDDTHEHADDYAADLVLHLNNRMRELGRNDRLRLCEASPSTELDADDMDDWPTTLEGLTCDSGSDRSATALITLMASIGADSAKPVPVAFAEILQLAQGWLRQRMTLHPQASTEPAPGTEQQSAAELVLHARAKAEAQGVAPWDLDLMRQALAQAQAEHPGQYEQLVELYIAQQQGGPPHA